MNRDDFLVEMQDVLQTEEVLTFDTVVAELPGGEARASMSTMAFLDSNFGVKTSMADYAAMKTVGDIAARAGV